MLSVVTSLACVVMLIGSAQAKNAAFKKIVVFGESTSDTGNTWILTGQKVWDPTNWNPFDPLVGLPTEPDPPLYDEGRWSNGRIWVDVLADRRTLRPDVRSDLLHTYTVEVTITYEISGPAAAR